ncbi:MAG: hypothetical protein OSB02_13110 [Rhodospirillaceae bacterium]|nr:hypothetical protein [Rhodospirillaceae bacterium]
MAVLLDVMADTIALAQLLMSMRISSPGWSCSERTTASEGYRSRRPVEVMTRGDAATGGARQTGLLCNKIIDALLADAGQ